MAQWLHDYKENVQGVDLSDEDDDEGLVNHYTFPSKVIQLASHHTMTHGPISVNIKDCMEWLTSEIDREVVISDSFVHDNWAHITELAVATKPIELFGRLNWDGKKDGLPLADAIWKRIAPHAHHQQECEAYVQASGLVSKTGVKEVRRTCRTIGVAHVVRQANRVAAETRDDIKRVQGRDKNALWLDYLDHFVDCVGEARKKISEEDYKRILKRVSSTKNKTSAIELKKLTQQFDRDLKKSRTTHKAEEASGVEVTPLAGDGILLRILTLKNNAEPAVNAEIKKRKIKITKRQKKSFTIAEKRMLLRKDEYKLIGTADKISDVKHIRPHTQEMKDLRPLQRKILDKENGIDNIEDEEE